MHDTKYRGALELSPLKIARKKGCQAPACPLAKDEGAKEPVEARGQTQGGEEAKKKRKRSLKSAKLPNAALESLMNDTHLSQHLCHTSRENSLPHASYCLQVRINLASVRSNKAFYLAGNEQYLSLQMFVSLHCMVSTDHLMSPSPSIIS